MEYEIINKDIQETKCDHEIIYFHGRSHRAKRQPDGSISFFYGECKILEICVKCNFVIDEYSEYLD